ncbi:MAG: hypothetical protein KAT77_00795 [Nanoarchaeota archaeon]|nr:hypothetical protein [Nanoarchaeota archaeon]
MVLEQLKAMEGWAIEAQQVFSSNKELALKNLENIYTQAHRMRGVSKEIFKNLASIQASIKNIRKEKNVDENVASLLETIKNSITLAEQSKEGRTLKGRTLKGRILKGRTLKGRRLGE